MLRDETARAFGAVDDLLARRRPRLHAVEIGRVQNVAEGVVEVSGLDSVRADEIVSFPQGLVGMAGSLRENGMLGAIVLGPSGSLSAGDPVRRSGRMVDVPVGPGLLGRVVDALGRPLDGRGPVRPTGRRPIERDAPAILDRAPVEVPLRTGIKAIDALVPVGLGQRELIVGDRQTGKTAIAIDTILNQQAGGVISVYCAIGQRGDAVARVWATLVAHGAMERCILVVAGGDDAPGLQFLAPYAATTIAEYFMERGRDVVIVYDDLTRHARAYRELSLLLRRPPGREAYPGDIFYVHARLLERSTHLGAELGGGSLTALPIVETQAQNLTAYIPTNLISITDGQIYLSPELSRAGLLPAIDIGRSVSRVGGKTQLPAYRAVAGPLRLAYAQFEELETFSRFGTRLDPATRAKLERGRRVREILKQAEHAPVPVAEQLAVMSAVNSGLFDGVPIDRIGRAEEAVRQAFRQDLPRLGGKLEGGSAIESGDRERMAASARGALAAIVVPLADPKGPE